MTHAAGCVGVPNYITNVVHGRMVISQSRAELEQALLDYVKRRLLEKTRG